MIRLILVLTFLFLFLILSTPILLIEWIIGKFNPKLKSTSSLAIVNWAFRIVLWLAGGRVTYIGEENIPKDTPVLYVGNHRSYFDVVMTYIRVPRPTGYIAKKEMLKIPILRRWMSNLHCLFLDRSNTRQGLEIVLQAIDKVKNGISICVFPEGTRNKEKDTFLPFHEGSMKIATKGKVPIVPISIVNAAGILEDHFPYMKKTKVVVEYCKPIYPDELSKEDQKNLGAYASQRIQEAYFKNKEKYFS